MLGLLSSTTIVKERIANIQAEVIGKVVSAQYLHSLVQRHKPDITSLKVGGEEQVFVRWTEIPLERRIPENPDSESIVTLKWKPVWRNEQGSIYFRYVSGTGYAHTYIPH